MAALTPEQQRALRVRQRRLFVALVVPTVAAGLWFGARRSSVVEECRARGGVVNYGGPRRAFPRCSVAPLAGAPVR